MLAFKLYFSRGYVRKGKFSGWLVDLLNIEYYQKISDVPMDLADASLMVVAAQKNLTEIASIDGDFYIYRDKRNRYLSNIF